MVGEIMNSRCKKILYMIIEEEHFISLDRIADEFKLSKRSIYYEICKINEWLESNGLPELEVTRGKGIHLDCEVKKAIEQKMESGKSEEAYIFSPTERIRVIICYIIHAETPIYIEQLSDYCKVSRNTIFNDLRVVVNQLQDYDLKLEYESKTGYKITGDAIRIRALFFLYFNMLHPLFNSGILKFINREEIYGYLARLKKIEKELHMDYVDGILLSLAALLPIMRRGGQNLYFPGLKKEELIQTKEYQLIENYFPELTDEEKVYLCLHLLGSRISVASEDFFEERSNQTVYEIAKALVAEFEKIACVVFDQKEKLEKALFIHINSSLYRYQYGIQIGNPMRDDIIREYPNLYEITKLAAHYLEQQMGLPISESETAYLALHFGAHLQTNEKAAKQLRILIVCVNGISTGNMLKREVIRLIPEAEIVGVAAASDIVNIHNICDLVISTVRIQSLVPLIVVHPILTDTDRKAILEHPLIKERSGIIDVEDLFNQIKEYVEPQKREKLKKKLISYFHRKETEQGLPVLRGPESLYDYLGKDKVLFIENKVYWTEALRTVGKPLIENGSIKENYIEKIINQLRYYGPYMFITPDVILAHAKPEDGVNHLDVAIGICHDPITFSKLHNAKVIIILAAEDQEKHLKILKDIMTIFSEEDAIENLMKAKNIEQIMQYFATIS